MSIQQTIPLSITLLHFSSYRLRRLRAGGQFTHPRNTTTDLAFSSHTPAGIHTYWVLQHAEPCRIDNYNTTDRQTLQLKHREQNKQTHRPSNTPVQSIAYLQWAISNIKGLGQQKSKLQRRSHSFFLLCCFLNVLKLYLTHLLLSVNHTAVRCKGCN